MIHKSSFKFIAAFLLCMGTILLTMLAFVPFLNELVAVEVAKPQYPAVKQEALPDSPEQVPVTVYYIMEDSAKKISKLYIEVFPVGSETIFYMELPTDSKVNLSEGLYKSLQTYGPELPQHVKLCNMPESFSAEYRFTACNRILSELLGMTFTEYVRADLTSFNNWQELLNGEKTSSGYFKEYAAWISESSSSRTVQERWMYYESIGKVTNVVTETAPGSREKDGYIISSKRSGECLEKMILGETKSQTE